MPFVIGEQASIVNKPLWSFNIHLIKGNRAIVKTMPDDILHELCATFVEHGSSYHAIEHSILWRNVYKLVAETFDAFTLYKHYNYILLVRAHEQSDCIMWYKDSIITLNNKLVSKMIPMLNNEPHISAVIYSISIVGLALLKSMKTDIL